ncbi:MAG: RecX family transcriptional regulator [Chitinophagales bacterium]|nr:RecX family transcriptional regulator [Bacteroidota bacterium]MBX7141991.1 RecX family transcriptional regulator [Chitinophagales bacterium]
MDSRAPKKILTPNEAFERAKKYCAFQERSHSEVRYKLLDYGLRGKDLEEVMARLIEEGFLNEERFASAFTGGKFRMKQWGKQKIKQELKRKGVSDYLIQKAMNEVKRDDYDATLKKLLEKKAATLKDRNIFTKKQKLSSYLIRKGYEPEEVYKQVSQYYRLKE